MIRAGIDELMNTTNSIFKLAVLASRRAQELSHGSNNLVGASPTEKYTTVALKEILQGKVTMKIKKG